MRKPAENPKEKPEYWDAPADPTKEQRLSYLADLMAQGRYRTRLTVSSLMALWGLSRCTLDTEVAEASRSLRTPPEELEERRDRWQAKVEAVVDMAMTSRSRVTGLPDFNAVLKGLELYATFSGMKAAEPVADLKGKLEINIVHAPDDSKESAKPNG